MKMTRTISALGIATLVIHLSTISSCTKEYSCETCPGRDTLRTNPANNPKIDSTIQFPVCATCNPTLPFSLNRFSFRNYKSLLCGNLYNSVLDSGKNVVIQGFLDCTTDTLFTLTGAFPPQTFDTDRVNISGTYSNFLLYDPPSNVILAVAGGLNGTPLTMNIVLDSFNYSTGIASFRFFGYAYTNKGGSSYITGDSSYISDGRIKAKVR
jgi:hypothetical protein